MKTIRKNVKKQINYWLELFGCKELIYNKKTIKLVPKNIVIQKCYSIVGESASFPYLEATATLSKSPKIMATVYLDNTTNKIYDIKITGDNVESILSYAKQNAEKNKLTLINLDTFQKEIIILIIEKIIETSEITIIIEMVTEIIIIKTIIITLEIIIILKVLDQWMKELSKKILKI